MFTSQEEVGKYIKTKSHLYQACLRNEYFLPTNPKNAFVTK
jgi:hypothetical protein